MAASRVGVVTEEEKQSLLERYLDIEWIDDVTEVKCVRCGRVPIHHYVSNCLHLYCRNCRTVFSDGGRWRCPQCKEYVTQLNDQHWELEDHIYQIRAHCPNKKYGCHYEGQLSTIPDHLKSCKHTREAALPAEFKGITLDTVVNQILRLNGVMEAIQGEVRALRVESEQKWMRIETMAANTQVLTQEVSEQREQLSHVKHTLKDVVELKDECQTQWKRTQTVEMKLDGLLNSIKVLTQDFNEHKEKCDNVKQTIEERVSSSAVEMQHLRTQLQQQQTLIDTNTEQNVNQLTRLNVSMGAMQSEVKDTRGYCEQLKATMDELTTDQLKKTAEWAHVEPVLKDLKEFRDQSETNWKQVKENIEELNKDLKPLRWDIHEQREQLANVKPILKDVNELKDNYKSNMYQTQQLETKVDGLHNNIDIIVKDLCEQKEQLANVEQHMADAKELKNKCEIKWNQIEQIQVKLDEWTTNTQALTQDLNEQKHMAIVTNAVKDVKELRDECERHWEQTKKFNDDISSDLKIFKWDVHEQKKQFTNVNTLITDVKDKCETNCDHIKTMEMKVEKLVSNSQVLTLGLNEQKGQLDNVEQLLQDIGSSAAVEIEQLKSLLEQQATLIDTNNTQGTNEMRRLNVRMEAMQREVMDLRANWESNWSEEKVQRRVLRKDLDGLKQQLVESRDRGSRDADDIQYLMCQFETSVHTLVNRCQVNLHGKQLMMAQTQMPHDALHSMTLLYQWHITDIKTKDAKWNDRRESKVFALTGYDCGAKARIDTYGYIFLQLIDYKGTKTPIDTRSMPRLTWVIESQSQTTQVKQQLTQQQRTHAIRTGLIQFDQSLDYGEDVLCCCITSFTLPPSVVSNGMKLSVYVEPPSMAHSFFSNNGILLWRLDNYKERKKMQVDDLIVWHASPYFYTSPQGYRVLLTLSLSEKTVTCGGLWFVKGEHDSFLTKQFPFRLTVTLFNHTDQSKNLVFSQQGNEASVTRFEFKTVSASSLESRGYVADDSLLIKAVVEPL